MKWIDDPPADWSTASDDPPTETADVSLETEKTDAGLVVRESGSEEAYICAGEGAIPLEDYA